MTPSTNKILIQVFSDIHMDLWNKLPIIKPTAPYLFLCGNICTLNHPLFFPFFDFCSKRWEKVFYVPGNCEFFSKKKCYNELNFEYKYKLEEKFKNVFYLNDECIPLNNDINVYGSIFWTYQKFHTNYEAKLNINDYNWISYYSENTNRVMEWDINYVKNISNKSYELLHNYLNTTDKPTIIITHFPPIRDGTIDIAIKPQMKPILSSLTWDNNTINKLNLNSVKCWISGHSKWSYCFDKNNCTFISNQLGYKDIIGKTNFKEDGEYEV